MTEIKKYQTPADKITKDSNQLNGLSNAINKVGELVKEFYNQNVLAFQSFPRRIQNKINQYFPSEPQVVINGPGTDIVKLDKDAIRVTPETEQRGTLFNEFVESEENPTVRTAEWYKLNQDQSVGDRNIPVVNFTYYGGLENGAFKVQPLTQFNDTTTVIPARNLKQEVVPIKEILNPDVNTLISQEELEKQENALINEMNGVADKYIPWYETKSWNRVLSNPYVVPNTGEQLSEKEMENISKRLQLYNNFDFSNTDSLQYYTGDYHNTIKYDQEKDVIDKAKQDLEEFKKRLPKYEEAFKKVQKEKLKSIKDFSSELSPEEQMLQQLHFSKPYKPYSKDVVYGGVLGIGNKHKEVPHEVYNLINPELLMNYVTPIDREFLKLYDQRLVDIDNTYSNLNKKLQKVQDKLEAGGLDGINVVTTNNDTIPISQYNAAVLDKKAILGNPKGSMFIADFGNMSQDQLVNEVNPYLKENPSVLFMPDMGSFSLYGLQNGVDPEMLKNTYMDVSQKPTYKQYWNQFTESESKAPYNPDVHYLIGVKKQGGHIHIKEKNKGKFTESAKRAGKSVQEHARDVVNNPKATKLQKKRAQFALNAKKWKHQNGGKLKYLDMFNNKLK